MVLELALFPESVRRKPLHAFALGVVITLLSFLFSKIFFPAEAGLVSVFFITMAVIPVFFVLLEKDEKEETRCRGFLKCHGTYLKTYAIFFLSVLLPLSFIYMASSPDTAQATFKHQLRAIEDTRITADAVSSGTMDVIIANNLRVVLLSFLFSVVFGASAVLVLSWNASVIAVFLGMAAKNYAGQFVISSPLALAQGFLVALMSLAFHGALEITSYIISGLAGGLLSIALMREKFTGARFLHVAKDSAALLFFAVCLLFFAAVIESFPV